MMPGTGEGKPPALIGILQSSGYAPLVLMTAAALIPGTFGNGIALVGHSLQVSFHMSNASLGAVAFVAQVAQLLWAVPLALWADRGSRKLVAGLALIAFGVFGSLMALSPNVWAFAFLYLMASVGFGVNNTVHNSYLSDAYPTEARGRVFSWHNLSDPISQTLGMLIFGFVVTVAHSWRYGLLIGPRVSRWASRSLRCANPKRVPMSPATSSRPRGWICTPSRRRRHGSCSVPP